MAQPSPTGTASTAATNNDDQHDESFVDKMKRMASNCGHATGLCCFKAKKQTQISALEFKISQRKKKFGVDYLTLVERHASQAALKGCLKEAEDDIAKFQEEIDELLETINDMEQDTNHKIIPSKGSASASDGGAGGANSKNSNRPYRTGGGKDTDDDDDDDDEANLSAPSLSRSKRNASPHKTSNSKDSSSSTNQKRKPHGSGTSGVGGRGGNRKQRSGTGGPVAGMAAATIPDEFKDADPSKWKTSELQFSGGTSFETQGEKEVIKAPIKEGIAFFKANPEKYVAMVYQTDMLQWPSNHQYTLVHRAGTKGYQPKDVVKGGRMTIILHEYQRLPPLKDNDLPAQYRDKYTDLMTHQKRKLHSRNNKPILPGRGMGTGDTPSLKIIGDVDPSDIYQGTVGDCWLLSGISALAEFDGAVKRLFRKTPYLEERPLDSPNQYIVTLWDLTTWKEVDITVDERLPVMADGSGRLLAAKPSEDGELWVCYLEKALAAHCGGWDKITGGQCTHAWALMTGCKEQYTISKNPKTGKFTCCAKYNPYEKKWAKHGNSPHDSDQSMWRVEWPKVGGGGDVNREISADELFQKMVAWDKTHYIVGAGTSGSSDKSSTDGLVDNHAYSVIESRGNVCGTGIDLLKLRNPWGRGEIEDGKNTKALLTSWQPCSIR